MRLCKHEKVLNYFDKTILKNMGLSEVYILSSEHTYRPMRVCIVAQLFFKHVLPKVNEMFSYNYQISWFKFHHSCGRIGKLRKFERASHWETESTPWWKTTLWAKVTSSPFCKYALFGLRTNSPHWTLYVTYRTW